MGQRVLKGQPGGGLAGLGLPTEIPPDLDRAAILEAMTRDKKKSGGQVRFALPIRIGEVQTGVAVENPEAVWEK